MSVPERHHGLSCDAAAGVLLTGNSWRHHTVSRSFSLRREGALQFSAAAPLSSELAMNVSAADGTPLAVGTGRHSANAWNLREVRAELKSRGLGWDQPPYADAAQQSAAVRVLVEQ